MVLPSTRRTSGAVHGDVDLIADRQLVGKVTRQQTGQSRGHSCSDKQRGAAGMGAIVELEQVADVIEVVAHRDDMGAGRHESLGKRRVRRG